MNSSPSWNRGRKHLSPQGNFACESSPGECGRRIGRQRRPESPTRRRGLGGTLYFAADEGVHGRELWKSDGTEAGTVLVNDINPSGSSNPFMPTDVNGTLLSDAYERVDGAELWKSDGTKVGTALAKDINPGRATSYPQELTSVGGTLFFRRRRRSPRL
jgi:ELWxxDGT repeat protein